MKKLIGILAIACVAGYVLAGSSGLTNPVNKRTTAERLIEKIMEFNNDVVTELDSNEDKSVYGADDSYMVDFGTCTNGQVVAFGATFTAAPLVLIAPTATNKTVTAAVTITNFSATGVGAFTNGFIAIGAQ